MPAVKLSPLFNGQTGTSSGAPASGYKVYTYAAGSTTQLATYTDSAGTVAQSNPIILNTEGRPTNGLIWLQAGLTYKFILKDANDVQVGIPLDNISGINDTGSSVSQWQASGVTPTYVSASSFTLSGDQTTEFHVGRRLQFTVTAGTVYGTILTSAYTTLTTVTMTMDSGQTLDSGLSVVNLSILRNDRSALPNAAAKSGANSDITSLTGLTSSLLRSGTTVASTSGTAIDFTGIPSWVKRITVEFNGVSLNSTSLPLVQIGTSSGIETTGYKAAVSWITGNLNSTAGIPMGLTGGGTANTFHGALVFTTLGSNVWVAQGALAIADANGGCSFSAGSKTLSGTLDRVRITTVSGTDTFDAGSVNILYE